VQLSQGGKAAEAGLIAQGIKDRLEDLADPASAIIHAGINDRPADANEFRSLGEGDQDISCASDTAIEPDTETGIGLLHLLMDLLEDIDRADGVEDEAAAVVADINAVRS
jgi:hypothetical protein